MRLTRRFRQFGNATRRARRKRFDRSTKLSRKTVANARACGSQQRSASVPQAKNRVVFFCSRRKCRQRAGGIAVRCVASCYEIST